MGEESKNIWAIETSALQNLAQKGLFQGVGVLLAAPTARSAIAQGQRPGFRPTQSEPSAERAQSTFM